MREYNVFISHSWNYVYEYDNLLNLLDKAKYFYWKNYSVPPEKTLTIQNVSNKKMTLLLTHKIKLASAVLIIGGKYINYHDWIKKEIEISKYYHKPIIGILPFGIKEVQNILKVDCNEIVGWNSNAIIKSIKRNAI